MEEHGHVLENCIYKQGGGLIQPQALGCDPWSRSRQTQVEVGTLASAGPVGPARPLQRTDTNAEGACVCERVCAREHVESECECVRVSGVFSVCL